MIFTARTLPLQQLYMLNLGRVYRGEQKIRVLLSLLGYMNTSPLLLFAARIVAGIDV